MTETNQGHPFPLTQERVAHPSLMPAAMALVLAIMRTKNPKFQEPNGYGGNFL